MPDILITRKVYTPVSTQAELSIGGEFLCWTLEPPHAGANPGARRHCIPQGRYRASLYKSPKAGYTVILLHDVPGHDFIELHVGNYPSETDGCFLPGLRRNTDCVLESGRAFDALMEKVRGWAAINVVVLDTMYAEDMKGELAL